MIMTTHDIKTNLPEPLAAHVASLVGPKGLFDNSDEYIRDLIRRDMQHRDIHAISQAISEGYDDIQSGRYFKSTGDLTQDLKFFEEKEQHFWA